MLIRNLRKASVLEGQPVAILQDLQGPRIRIGEVPEAGVLLKNSERVTLVPQSAYSEKSKTKELPYHYARLAQEVEVGQHILIADGVIDLRILRISGPDITCAVSVGGLVKSHKGINVPGATFSVAAVTEKDKKDLVFGVEQKVDYIALSFVRTPEHVKTARTLLKRLSKRHPLAAHIGIIAKIERPHAVQNIEKIIKASDAVMVARGDLGIETQAYKVPIIKKYIIDLCLARAKPVIVATQMLDSMIRNSRPTRAEVSDVAAAVIDHADALMLSGETASGAYPVESCRMMRDIIAETEKSPYDDLRYVNLPKKPSLEEAIAHATRMIVKEANARAVIGIALTGTLSRMLSRFRPEVPILIAVRNEREKREVMLSWGIIPFETYNTIPQEITGEIIAFIKKQKLAKKGEKIIILSESKKRAFQGGKFLINLQSM